MPPPGPDPDAGAEAELARLLRRLRSLSPRAWAAGERRAAVAELAADLVALDPQAAGRPLPEIADHAWADALTVLGADALAAGADPERVLAAVRRTLERTR